MLTGAAWTGKTTLVELLAEKGYQIIPESARIYFEQEMAKGRNLADIRKNGAILQREIAAMQWKFESECLANRITFLDRALPEK